MFGKKTTVPNTISDRQMTDLSRRAQKANPSWLSDKAIKQRKASNAQQRKASQS
ncbi:hypothetical protein QTQ03_26555 [Micromonospora sp. WMMA1363]|uniref:hypothetical protein n=1 Tax=Micromonospora sp. WMMA1363 TaxID=3053985 RepID=UPI00259C9206|nr:hypothetical protein [Micromonospora sp. WMMA1363]MDM4720130.1 hypothetical protein [Micromonospora sp. WMMA1363]MDM4722990.1 hypothetical protein [Micromonospora sp. WMMA1363]